MHNLKKKDHEIRKEECSILSSPILTRRAGFVQAILQLLRLQISLDDVGGVAAGTCIIICI